MYIFFPIDLITKHEIQLVTMNSFVNRCIFFSDWFNKKNKINRFLIFGIWRLGFYPTYDNDCSCCSDM